MTVGTPSGLFEIRAPLLAFDRVSRLTGWIRRQCVFTNRSEHPLEVALQYDFKDHSWLHFEPVGESVPEAGSAAPGTLLLQPGRNRVDVLIDTDSSTFPYDSFRGRVAFLVSGTGSQGGHSLEISFEEIADLADFAGYAAIDLGTTNSMASLYHLRRDALRGEPWSPALEDGLTDIPSAVFLRNLVQFRRRGMGGYAVGRAALREYREGAAFDPRSLVLSAKRLLGAGNLLAADATGAGGRVDPGDVLHVLGRHLREQAQSNDTIRARIRRLMVTFPPTWDYRRIEAWKQVFHRLGFSDDELDLTLDEASAAGLFHVYRWTSDPDARRRLLQDLEVVDRSQDGSSTTYQLRLLSFDFGGGTTDLALIQVRITVAEEILRLQLSLLGSDSLEYGGDQVTLALFRILKRRLALVLADPEAFRGEEEAEADAPPPATGPLGVPLPRPGAGMFALPGQSRRVAITVTGEAKGAAQILKERRDEVEAHITAANLPPDLEAAVDEMVPTRYWRSPEEPVCPDAKQAFHWLWDKAEDLKRAMFREANRRESGIALDAKPDGQVQGVMRLKDIPDGLLPHAADPAALEGLQVAVTVAELHDCIRRPLQDAVERARILVGDAAIDRVVLNGQSSWIPLVRRLFMQPKGEGGFGLGPHRISFDGENAKAAVSKGACLLRVMRDTMVGFEVDVSDFRSCLLADVFYKSPLAGKRVLFAPGPIDDLQAVEECPDPGSFASHLAVFQGKEGQLLGQFDFSSDGEALPDPTPHAMEAATNHGLDTFPDHAGLMEMRARQDPLAGDIISSMRDWPQRAVIAYVEQGAAQGSPDRPIYRYYLTRNRNLIAVRDQGEGGKRLFPLTLDDRPHVQVPPEENPFSGVH